MSKKRNNKEQRVVSATVERVERAIEQVEVIEQIVERELASEAIATPRRFVPRACTACTALRPPNTNYSRVYATVGSVRYCKCGYCGETWSQEASA